MLLPHEPRRSCPRFCCRPSEVPVARLKTWLVFIADLNALVQYGPAKGLHVELLRMLTLGK